MWVQNSEFVQGQYALTASNELRFELGAYDPTKTLVIDPTLNYVATFGGSSKSEGMAIAVDSGANAYVTGMTQSNDFASTVGAFQPSYGGVQDAIVRKFDPTGAVVYSTYLGGTDLDWGFGIAVDSSGSAYVTGGTGSTDFPTTPGAFQTLALGCSFVTGSALRDAFLSKLSADGSSLVYSTYLGGSGCDQGESVAVDGAGEAVVVGSTNSADFPTAAPLQPGLAPGSCPGGSGPIPCGDAFITKFSADGSSLVFSTYLGGTEADGAGGVALDAAGNVYVAGGTNSFDFPVLNAFQRACAVRVNGSGVTYCGSAFVVELDPSGSALAFSTYLGGSANEGGDAASAVALDSAGNIYVTGWTNSTNFPTANAFQPSNASVPGPFAAGYDVFVTEFAPGGSSLVYSTYLGGSGDDLPNGIAVDSLGEAFVTGNTNSTDFPIANALQANFTGAGEAFVTAIQAAGKGLIYSTYLGINANSTTADDGFGIAVDLAGNAWVTGLASSDTTFVAAISRPEVVPRIGPPRQSVGAGLVPAPGRPHGSPLQSTSGVTAALAGSIALDMARVHAAPASLDFGAQVVGATSAPETVTISNLGTAQNHTVPGAAPLTFSAITASDGFSVASGGTCSTSSPVAPGGNCTVDVAFAPTVGGNLTGTLTLTDNGIGSPHSAPLSGVGQDFTLVTSQSSATLKAGVTATILLSVAPQGGFNHPLDLSCDDPAPHSTCSINPTSVTPSGASGATAVASITTTAASQVAPRGPNGPQAGPWAHRDAPLLIVLVLLALLAVAAASRRRRPRAWIPACAGMTSKSSVAIGCLALALLLVVAWAACGGGGQPGTPAGTYTISIKAADTQANLSHSTTVTLTVH